MSWICPKCETENPDWLKSCEVCDSSKQDLFHKLPISYTTRYYISGRQRSYQGSELILLGLPKGTLVRKMLTDEWIPIEQFDIPKPHISVSSYYYAKGIKGVYKISELREMHLPKTQLIREVLTERWFPLNECE